MLNTPPSSAQEIPSMLHLILKAYRVSITVDLSAHQQSAESLVPWGRLLFQVVNLSLPSDAVPEDEEEREKSPWWKAKKQAYATLGRMFDRSGIVCTRFERHGLMHDKIQIWKPLTTPVSDGKGVRGICQSLCHDVCTRDSQGVSSSSRVVHVQASVAVKEMPLPDFPILHRMVCSSRRVTYVCVG